MDESLLICASADLHGRLPEVPECDLLLLAGDIAGGDDLEKQRAWLKEEFAAFLLEIPAKLVIGIGGNHDRALYEDPELAASLPWIYLNKESVELLNGDLVVYGVPDSPPSFGVFQSSEKELAEIYSSIPQNADIVLSHGPPYGLGDSLYDIDRSRVGSPALRKAIQNNNFGWVVSGHIHEDFGRWRLRNIKETDTYVSNVSLGDLHQNPVQRMEFDTNTKNFEALPFRF